MAFLLPPSETVTNNDVYDSSDEEFKNRLRLGSLMAHDKGDNF